MFLSELSKSKLQEDIDEYSDPYFLDTETSDLKQVTKTVCVSSLFCVIRVP